MNYRLLKPCWFRFLKVLELNVLFKCHQKIYIFCILLNSYFLCLKDEVELLILVELKLAVFIVLNIIIYLFIFFYPQIVIISREF